LSLFYSHFSSQNQSGHAKHISWQLIIAIHDAGWSDTLWVTLMKFCFFWNWQNGYLESAVVEFVHVT
jgi:hypothetical protein